MRGEEYWNTIEHQPTQAIYFFNFSISEILRNESSFSNKIESGLINGVWVQIQTVPVTMLCGVEPLEKHKIRVCVKIKM